MDWSLAVGGGVGKVGSLVPGLAMLVSSSSSVSDQAFLVLMVIRVSGNRKEFSRSRSRVPASRWWWMASAIWVREMEVMTAMELVACSLANPKRKLIGRFEVL